MNESKKKIDLGQQLAKWKKLETGFIALSYGWISTVLLLEMSLILLYDKRESILTALVVTMFLGFIPLGLSNWAGKKVRLARDEFIAHARTRKLKPAQIP